MKRIDLKSITTPSQLVGVRGIGGTKIDTARFDLYLDLDTDLVFIKPKAGGGDTICLSSLGIEMTPTPDGLAALTGQSALKVAEGGKR